MKRGIEVEIQRFYNVLLGKCNYIPNELRGELELWDKETGYMVSSDDEPCFYDNMYLSICGTKKEKDNLAFCYAYDTYEEAFEAQKVFQKLIYQFNKEYCREEILDSIEKKYLENVLRPFQKRDLRIEKVGFQYEYAYLCITFNDAGEMGVSTNDTIMFPVFKANRCYKGMKKNKKYSLKELGLFKEAQA